MTESFRATILYAALFMAGLLVAHLIGWIARYSDVHQFGAAVVILAMAASYIGQSYYHKAEHWLNLASNNDVPQMEGVNPYVNYLDAFKVGNICRYLAIGFSVLAFILFLVGP